MNLPISDYLQNLEVYQVRNKTILSKERVVSVDALRGFDMFWIMGGDLAFKGLDNIFHNTVPGFLKVQMDHVEWFGFHFYDIIMPLFLFLVGVSMVYSYRKRLSAATSDIPIWNHTQLFNRNGYAAPKIETVRVGLIGLGMRGPGAVERLDNIEGVEIKALCDERLDRVKKAQKILSGYGLPAAKAYGGTIEAWKEICQSTEIDLVYICTPWQLHTPMAVFAMENGKHAVSEVPAATTLEEAWQLVETSEKTKKRFMMDWRLIDCLRNGLPLDEDVYDAALWNSIAPLSEWSVANRSDSIDVPDFTCGSCKSNQPVDISLTRGGNTGVRTKAAGSENQLKI